DEGEAAIAAGIVDENLVLQATEVLAKHDEKYTPPEVADAMNQAYEHKQEQKQEYKPKQQGAQ
ncbi:cytochrome c maturation protein CcmE, partial [bacterium]|nr:cytochrome c maturation protein CcmE [bacterium]